jgi:endonuclease/exonuclease/phosphatase family metal-dependent hydrolase
LALAVLSACGAGSQDRAPSSLASDGVTLKVLSYNAYLIGADPNGKPSLDGRLELLPDALAATGADVILMQEVWSASQRAKLAKAMESRGYAGAARETPSLWPPYFYGNGLFVFVKAPLAIDGETAMMRFPQDALLNLDTYTTKGAIRVKVQVPGAGAVDVVAAHTSYLPWRDEQNDYDRSMEPKLFRQVRAVTDFAAQGTSRVKIVAGDFNTDPREWRKATKSFDETTPSGVFKALVDGGGLTDAMTAVPSPTCGGACATWDNSRNALIRQGLFDGVPGDTTEPDARLDWVLAQGEGVTVASTAMVLDEERDVKVKGEGDATSVQRLPLSDHFGVLAELVLPAAQ